MNIEAIVILFCSLPLIGFCTGVLVGLLLAMFKMDERAGTGLTPSMPAGDGRFKPESKLQKWHRSDDMLENGKHPSRNNKDNNRN